MSVLCYWFMCDFLKQMEPDNVNRSYSIAEKGKVIISATDLAVNPPRAFQLNPRRQGFLLDGLPISFIQPMQVLLPSKFTLHNFIV